MADAVARQILASPKYRGLDPSLVRRVAGEAAQRSRDRGQALRYARRKLHQAFGAFLVGSPARAVADVVASVAAGRAGLREAAIDGMRAHASTAERIDWLVPFYQQVGAWCGPAGSVADLACGLNPLAMPWMRLAPGASYWACEIDRDLAGALRELDPVMPARLTVTTCDLVAAPPVLRADVALLLKTVTTLEQQRAGASRRVLSALNCRHVVLSLPRRSLGGRREYTDDARALVRKVTEGTPFRWSDEAVLGDELLSHLVRVG
jgi:16S rRNA (guanine(1405)-N(7))-methyltransferase